MGVLGVGLDEVEGIVGARRENKEDEGAMNDRY